MMIPAVCTGSFDEESFEYVRAFASFSSCPLSTAVSDVPKLGVLHGEGGRGHDTGYPLSRIPFLGRGGIRSQA